MLISVGLRTTFLSKLQRCEPFTKRRSSWGESGVTAVPPCAVTAVVPHRIPRRALDSWRRTCPESAAHANTDAAEDWNRTSAAYRSPLVAEVEEFVEAVDRWSKKCPRRAEAGRGCALVNKPQLGLFFPSVMHDWSCCQLQKPSVTAEDTEQKNWPPGD